MGSKARGVALVASSHSKSLFNGTLSPGWTREECGILRLAIMKIGVGGWKEIIESGCLPGKTPAQLSLQTQRLCGQQSIGEFMGIHMDPFLIFEENAKKTGVVRKNGCIINTGNNPTKEERLQKIAENQKKYGLTKEQIDIIQLPDRRNEFALKRNAKQERLRLLKERLEYLEGLYELKIKNEPPPPPESEESEDNNDSPSSDCESEEEKSGKKRKNTKASKPRKTPAKRNKKS